MLMFCSDMIYLHLFAHYSLHDRAERDAFVIGHFFNSLL